MSPIPGRPRARLPGPAALAADAAPAARRRPATHRPAAGIWPDHAPLDGQPAAGRAGTVLYQDTPA